MNNVLTPTTAHTPWCTEHETDCDECTTTPIRVGSSSCHVWLVQPRQSAAPTVIIDVPPQGGELTLDQADALRDALAELRGLSATSGTEARP